MWLSIGYTIPQKGDNNTSGGSSPTFFIVKEDDITIKMETESSGNLMVQQVAP
jgi:hypothetical protein